MNIEILSNTLSIVVISTMIIALYLQKKLFIKRKKEMEEEIQKVSLKTLL